MAGVNRLSLDRQAQIAALLVEGNTSRGAARILDCTLNTVLRNGLWLGEACQRFHDNHVHGLKTKRVEADEAWSFIGAKDASLPPQLRGDPDLGTTWTWVSFDPDHRFLLNWHIGKHEASDAANFMNDLARRIPGRIQLTTDCLRHYRPAVQEAFGARVDYAQIHKEMYEATFTPDGRYQPTRLKSNTVTAICGKPDPKLVTTTSIESQNTRLRRWNSRYVRNTIAFSRRLRNLRASFALHATYYNFCRVLPAIRCSPAVEIGLTDHVWEIEELIERLNVDEGREVGYLNRKKETREEEDVPYEFAMKGE